MTDGLDRQLMDLAVETQMYRVLEVNDFTKLAAASGVSRPTLWRMRTAPKTGMATFQKLEAPLGLPAGTLAAIGHHDLKTLRRIGAPEDLISWVALQIENPPAT